MASRVLQVILLCVLIAVVPKWADLAAQAVQCGASPNPTEVGRAVQFTCTPTSGTAPFTYSWDFNNDGLQESEEQNPTYTYDLAGIFHACVTVTDALGVAETCCVHVGVNPPLAVDCAALPNPTEVGHAVVFTCNPGGGVGPFAYSWDFNNDGQQESDEQNPSYAYDVAGIFHACVTVTDALGVAATCCIHVGVNPPLAVDCAASPSPVKRGGPVSFTATTTGGVQPYTYLWDFDDGASSVEQNPSHAYYTAGSHQACVTVTDSLGISDVCCADITVKAASDGEDGAVAVPSPTTTPTPSPSATSAPLITPASSATPRATATSTGTPPTTSMRTPRPPHTTAPVVTATAAPTATPAPTPVVTATLTPSPTPTPQPTAGTTNVWTSVGPLLGLVALGSILYYLNFRRERAGQENKS